ncbi:MAG TPA: AzlC family ABC transporter permease [Macromonas sp.]|nr:AzlC family ABC transporter permease [Macromonas sp.]
MFPLKSYRRWPEFQEGVRDQLTVALGVIAWGLMTGVAMVESGLDVPAAVGMTLLVYAGSAQLAAVPLIIAGAPLWVVWLAAFCVNLRFVVFSAHLRPYVRHLSRGQRLLTGYATGDLSYVFFARRYTEPGRTPEELERQQAYLAGHCLINYLCWMVSSLLGVALSQVVPTAWGLGFAGTLALLGVGASLVTSRLRGLAAVLAGSAAIVAWSLPLRLNILLAIVVSVAVCLWLEKLGPRGSSGKAREPRHE